LSKIRTLREPRCLPSLSCLPCLSSTAARSCDLRVGAADCGRLLELLSLVPDPRCRRGVASILAIAAAAVLAGCTSVLAIGEWAAEAPQELLAPLDLRGWAVTLDAMHCQRETARFLAEDKKAAYVFTAAKDNQPGLVARLDRCPGRTCRSVMS
jgi:DDE_Tnp_1-associated